MRILRRVTISFVFLAISFSFILVAAACNEFGRDVATDSEFEPVELIRVVDGDTLLVSRGGEEERVRLLLIDSPESVHPDEERNTQEGSEASAHMKSLVSKGATVYLQADVTDRDKYGRLLRYVWLEVPQDPFSTDEVSNKMLNAMMVRDGFAEVFRYGPDSLYEGIFSSL